MPITQFQSLLFECFVFKVKLDIRSSRYQVEFYIYVYTHYRHVCSICTQMYYTYIHNIHVLAMYINTCAFIVYGHLVYICTCLSVLGEIQISNYRKNCK